ncbi:transposase [Alicyclobacillus fastidiosus]|uniref:Transposase n=1 Tax=Alicyclobacillus fastidiosus TaxID=392011 RepID=A0ABY6ZKD9_9BACL|nr:transposase [Alicyclobacillus fastidiosus]WAH41246.1 transposase [Alicyclobacillus fastidiosus]WAH43092.1 transposase [Alicyclobacillus fastidiosus]WAH43384.1 transposase [Alicyclobacillus fastidiosus]GMA62840.1 hypothetical protein GCM10025859_32800 [Alicyclobacillus fastidiosus]
MLCTLWERFDLSLLLSQSGIFKVRGVATWVLAFLYVVGLINRSPSVNALSSFYNQDGLLQQTLGAKKISQSALSRFLTGFSGWDVFNNKRTERLQDDTDTALTNGDVLALDDTHAPHPYAKKIPFLYWLYDSSSKTYTWAMNIVALHAVRRNGVEYPWSYSIWKKPESETAKESSKLDLAWRMLQDVRKQVSCRLWVVMDRWYFSKPFLRQCESANFDWITKAKRNTKLFRRLIEPGTGRERFVPIQPIDLIREVYPRLKMQPKAKVASVVCQDIYIQMPTEKRNRKGQMIIKMKYTPIAAVVGWRVKEESKDTERSRIDTTDESDHEPAADYKGAYLLMSNRHDVPQEVLGAWLRRWNIEILFRTAKQELGMLNCHSQNENHIHAHLTLLFTAETLIRYLLWAQRKTAGKEDCTHGQVIRNLICIRCHTRRVHSRNKPDSITLDLDTVAKDFARLIRRLWPPNLEIGWFCPFSTNQLLGTTA